MRAVPGAVSRQVASLSVAGLVAGTLCAACSLTPSLLPRPPMYQGFVSGLSLVLGYTLGTAGQGLSLVPRAAATVRGPPASRDRLVSAFAAAVALVFLWQASEWQNSVGLMGMDDVSILRFKWGRHLSRTHRDIGVAVLRTSCSRLCAPASDLTVPLLLPHALAPGSDALLHPLTSDAQMCAPAAGIRSNPLRC